mmetsp:Transcript_25998/g.38114  ORF Transcript_25998/g.38114 Transcript_25998/m.38114 type:complete len:417 (-) Transcript_25998:408-1658(-)
MTSLSSLLLLVILTKGGTSNAFQLPSKRYNHGITTTSTTTTKITFLVPQQQQQSLQRQSLQQSKKRFFVQSPSSSYLSLLGRKDDDDDDDDDEEEGMIEAFRGLDSLSSLDLSDDKDDTSLPPNDPIAAKLAELEEKIKNNDFGTSSTEATPEEAKLYGEMMRELEEEGQAGMYGNLMGELMDGKEPKLVQDLDKFAAEDDDNLPSSSGVGFGKTPSATTTSSEIDPDMDEFMERALREALEEVTSKTDIDPKVAGSIRDDEETMKELNRIFDRANEQLMESVQEIREEQAAMTKANAEARRDKTIDDERRLAEAEGSVTRLLENVNKETMEVERAIEDLKRAQSQMDSEPLTKLTNLRGEGGIVKQGALVGFALFSLRALAETTALGGVDGEQHFIAAVIQAGIAFVCGIYFFFF